MCMYVYSENSGVDKYNSWNENFSNGTQHQIQVVRKKNHRFENRSTKIEIEIKKNEEKWTKLQRPMKQYQAFQNKHRVLVRKERERSRKCISRNNGQIFKIWWKTLIYKFKNL